MKFSTLFVSAFAACAFAAPAPAIEARRTLTVTDVLNGLSDTINTYTASINSTLATLSSGADRDDVVSSVNADITQISDAIHNATSQMSPLTRRQNTTLGDLPHAVLGQLNGQPLVLAELLLPALQELNPALESVLETLSLSEVYVALQPLLITELPALVTELSTLVQGLLVSLSPLLNGVGLLLGSILLGLGL